MLKDLQEQARKYPQALDWIDDHADLLDTNLVDYLIEVYNSLNDGRQTFILNFLIDPDGAGFTKEEVLGIIINDYKIGKWEGLDAWNKDCATNTTLNCTLRNLGNLRHRYDESLYNTTVIKTDDLIQAGLEYAMDLYTCHIPHVGSGCPNFSIYQYKNYCEQKDLYVPVEQSDEMPAAWVNKCDSLSQPFSIFGCDNIRTVTSKNTLYFKNRDFDQRKSNRPFIMVSVDHIAKAGLDKANVNTILPKHIVDKYNLPVVQY